MEDKEKILVITGPTATGKTLVAAHVAKRLDGEIISADSRQVYRGMDIGTGKDLTDYVVDGSPVPYHLIDIADPGTEYNVYQFRKDFEKARLDIISRNKQVVVCGGTGMYIESITSDYRLDHVPENPELRKELSSRNHKELVVLLEGMKEIHNVTDTTDKDRTIRAIEIEEYYKLHPPGKEKTSDYVSVIFGVRLPRHINRERITQRLQNRLDGGMVDEVKGLLDQGITPEQLKFYGLEYKFITQHIEGELSFDEMFRLLNTAIHQFAKRQMTWFRRMQKRGQKIRWIDGEMPMEEKVSMICSEFERLTAGG